MIGINLHQYHATCSKEIGVMKAVGYQNRGQRNIYLRGSLDFVGIALLGIYGCTRGGKFGASTIVSHFYPSITKVFELNLLSVLGTLVRSITWLCLSLLPGA